MPPSHDSKQQLHARLERWVEAGLLTTAQAAQIQAYEAAVEDPSQPEVGRHQRRATSPAEAIGYVGAALALAASALIVGELWRELLVGGRLAVSGLVTAVMAGAGLVLRTSASVALQRLTSVLFAMAVAGTGWFAEVLCSDLLAMSSARTQVVASAAMVLVAVALYLPRRRPFPQLVVLGSLLFCAISLLGLSPLPPTAGWYGVVIGAVGVVWVLLAVGSWITPQTVGEVAGVLVILLGIQVGASGGMRAGVLAVGLAIAGGLVIVAVRTDSFHFLVVGSIGLFVFSPQLVFEVFGDAIGAPATLLLVGVLLVLLALGLARARREVATTASGGSRAGEVDAEGARHIET